MLSMSSKAMELKCITYLVSGSRLSKMEAAKSEKHVSQLVDMMAVHISQRGNMLSGADKSRKRN